jgi:uncharacterized protein involved in exopolysaccharide biosynthesis
MIGRSTVSAYLPILFRRKRLILASGLATACIGFAIAKMLPLQYASEGSLIVEHRASTVNDPQSPTVLNGILTQVDVLKSKGLIQRSVHELTNTTGLIPTMRLAAPVTDYLSTWTDYLSTFRDKITNLWRSDDSQKRDAETDKITYIQDHLRVEAKDNSSVISVQFEAGAPDTAAAVVNATRSPADSRLLPRFSITPATRYTSAGVIEGSPIARRASPHSG